MRISMKVEVARVVDPRKWDEFVWEHPFGSIYHHSAWRGAVAGTYGYDPIYHLIRDGGRIVAAAASLHVKSRLTGDRIVSLPFSDNCDLLAGNGREAEALLTALESTRSEMEADYVELRFLNARLARDAQNARNLIGTGQWDAGYCLHRLCLERDGELLFRSFHPSCIRRAVRTARKRGVETCVGGGESDLRTFYRLHVLTRRKHGVPVQPFRFFENLWRALAPGKLLTLLLARYRGRVVAGIIVLWFKNTAYYKFGASEENFQYLRANQLLMWRAIELARARGCATFDFGRTSLANEGLCAYKERWGSERLPLYYARFPLDKKPRILAEASGRHARLKKILRGMPPPLIRLGGELFYRHLA